MKKKVPATVGEYLLAFEGEPRKKMDQLRKLILDSDPEITEKISWAMPTFVLGGNLVHFAGHAKHIGFYPGIEAMSHFSQDVEEYHTTKGAMQLPYTEDIPVFLIQKIVNFRIAQQKNK